MSLSSLLALALAAGPAGAAGTKAAATPPMGFNSWNAYSCDSNAQALDSVASWIHNSGLEQDGYTYVDQDGCYTDLEGLDSPNTYGVSAPVKQDPETCGVINGRLPDGELFVNPYLYPSSRPCADNGVKLVANYVHALGLKLGVYLDASNNWNCEEIPGSYGFDTIDANTLADWGVDLVKADWGCDDSTVPPASNAPKGYTGIDAPSSGTTSFGGPTFATNKAYDKTDQATQEKMYDALGRALSKTKHHILFSVAGAGTLNAQSWGFKYGAMVRPTPDSNANFVTASSNKHYGGSLVGIVNSEAETYEQYTGPGHWIDPDMMQVGNFTATGGATALNEDESEMSMFSELSDPLLMSTNLCAANCGPDVQPATTAELALARKVFGNRRVVAVDQQWGGQPAKVVSGSDIASGGTDLIMSRKLKDGEYAVTFFNESTTVAATMSVTAAAAGLPAASNYELQNLWSGAVTASGGAISATVAPGQTVMLRVAAGTKAPWQPAAAQHVKQVTTAARLTSAARSLSPAAKQAAGKTPNNLIGISCPSKHECVTADAFGGVAVLNPSHGGALAFRDVDQGRQLVGISCVGVSACVTLDLAGNASVFNPLAAHLKARVTGVDLGREPTAIDCVSATQCVIVDGSGYALIFDAKSGKVTARHQVDPWIYLASVSCPSAGQCTAVGGGGNGGSSEVTFNPRSGKVSSGGVASNDGSTGNGDTSVSCPTTSQCTAVDGDGNEFTFDPATEVVNAAGLTPIEGDSSAIGSGLGVITSVACSSGTRCTAVDLTGNAVTFDPASGAVNSAGVARVDPNGNGLESIACSGAGASCTAVDLDGRAVTFNAATGKRTELRKS